jgi:hypothetical protein
MSLDSTLQSAHAQLASGEKWRAKEILLSSLGNYGYRKPLLLLLGRVLLSMEDKMQAGQYLFLSAEECSEEEQAAIDLFIGRFGRNGHGEVLRRFPEACRLRKLSHYPEPVQERLRSLGEKEDLVPLLHRLRDKSEVPASIGCLGVFVGVVICAIVGFVSSLVLGFQRIVDWIF